MSFLSGMHQGVQHRFAQQLHSAAWPVVAPSRRRLEIQSFYRRYATITPRPTVSSSQQQTKKYITTASLVVSTHTLNVRALNVSTILLLQASPQQPEQQRQNSYGGVAKSKGVLYTPTACQTATVMIWGTAPHEKR